VLKFLITYSDKTENYLDNVLTVILNADVEVPADDLTITIPYDEKISENADYITAFLDEKTVFKGQIDEIIGIKSTEGAITKITARSPSAFLLDNEAEPLTYINPSADFIFSRHLKPFGLTEYNADDVPFFGTLKIDKGMTHWQVFRNFCINRYGAEPRITGEGKAYFKGFETGETILFGKSGVEYTSIRESKRRFKLISEVRLKLTESGTYGGNIKNENPDCDGIERVRYVNATADKTTIQTADNIIRKSNSDSYSIALECVGCLIESIGRSAVLDDEMFGRIENLTVRKIRYSVGTDGEKTTVTLGKERF
jgi:hypothetical protein